MISNKFYLSISVVILSIFFNISVSAEENLTSEECNLVGGNYNLTTGECTENVEATENDCLSLGEEFRLIDGNCIRVGDLEKITNPELCESAGGIFNNEYGCIPAN